MAKWVYSFGDGKAEGRDPRIKGCLTCHGEHGIIQKGDVTERYATTGLVRTTEQRPNYGGLGIQPTCGH